jgi:hypothetical protein
MGLDMIMLLQFLILSCKGAMNCSLKGNINYLKSIKCLLECDSHPV